MTAPARLMEAMTEAEQIIAENERLKARVEQLEQLLATMRDEGNEAKAIIEKFEPYMDIVEKAESQKSHFNLSIKSPETYTRLCILARQVGGAEGDRGWRFQQFLDGFLSAATEEGFWLQIYNRRFRNRQLRETNEEQT